MEINHVKSETLTYGETWQDENNAGGGNSVVAKQFSGNGAQCP